MNILEFNAKCESINQLFTLSADSYQESYDSYIEQYDLSTHKCGSCGSVGTCKFHSEYVRAVIGYAAEVEYPSYIDVKVVKCTCPSCKQRHHALLPDWICPFLSYTYSFIVEVLSFYFNEAKQSARKTAMTFNLNRKTIKKFLDLLEEFEIPMKETPSFQKEGFNMRKFFARLCANSQLFWSFLSEFLEFAGVTFLASRKYYSHIGKPTPYIFCPMGQNQIKGPILIR